VAAVAPYLSGEKSIKRWSVNTNDPDKVLLVEGDEVAPETVRRLVADAGFRVLGDVEPAATVAEEKKSFWVTYTPLLLILGYLIGVVGLLEFAADALDGMRAMGRFMAGFFLVFSFFKLLNLPGFVDAFRTYDVLAQRVPAYGWAYPFIELLLGVAYLLELAPVATNIVTLAIMSVGMVGVAQALVQRRQIQCACLGSTHNLPMSRVTLIEDVLMAGMAVVMLVAFSRHLN
jgi:hypothetical protein